MNKQEIKTKVDELGHKIDDGVENYAEKHSYSKGQVWLLATGALCLIGLAVYVYFR